VHVEKAIFWLRKMDRPDWPQLGHVSNSVH
jgi:hypothetical protein